jgi:hypothetical protein
MQLPGLQELQSVYDSLCGLLDVELAEAERVSVFQQLDILTNVLEGDPRRHKLASIKAREEFSGSIVRHGDHIRAEFDGLDQR